MQNLKPLIAILLCFICAGATAQQPSSQAIEKDLKKSFERIEYWGFATHHDKDGHWIDSLEKANQTFGKKLQQYTNLYPGTIAQAFNSLKDDLYISTSDDGKFRIYSWYTRRGGTMQDYGNVFQYKISDKTASLLKLGRFDEDHEEFNIESYNKVFGLTANGQVYYLAVKLISYSHLEHGESIQVFTVKDGKLNDKVKLIKTASGLHNSLSYSYKPEEVSHEVNSWSINYDKANNVISLPLVNVKGKITGKRILYKFTGKYFEKVKS